MPVQQTGIPGTRVIKCASDECLSGPLCPLRIPHPERVASCVHMESEHLFLEWAVWVGQGRHYHWCALHFPEHSLLKMPREPHLLPLPSGGRGQQLLWPQTSVASCCLHIRAGSWGFEENHIWPSHAAPLWLWGSEAQGRWFLGNPSASAKSGCPLWPREDLSWLFLVLAQVLSFSCGLLKFSRKLICIYVILYILQINIRNFTEHGKTKKKKDIPIP